MIDARGFVEAATGLGFGLYTGVPCSYLKPLINHVIDSKSLRYVGAVNEGDAVAIAAGAQLGGQRSVVMFQNSGLGNAVSPLTSLTHTFRIPVLLIPTLRGEPDGAPDEPQHELMGKLTTDLLELMDIVWEFFPVEQAEIPAALDRAGDHMDRSGLPYALVMRKGSVAPTELNSEAYPMPPEAWTGEVPPARETRRQMLLAIQAATSPDDVVIASTGYNGRELYACEDRSNQLYMVGSMGCASSLGLGLAISQPGRRVIIVDGDGAALMRLGALSTLGHERPPNLVHVLLDNGQHESTGGQATVSPSIDFPSVAAAAGYPRVRSLATGDALRSELNLRPDVLSFVHVPTVPGVPEGLPRPKISPAEVAIRLQKFLAGGPR